MKFPKHISLSLTHNEHSSIYKTASEIIGYRPDYYSENNWVSLDEMEKAISSNNIWTAHWYPNTPVGFHVCHASDLDLLLSKINEEFEENTIA